MQIVTYSYTKDDIQKCANYGKEAMLGHMIQAEMITKELYNELMNHYAVVIVDREPTFGTRIRKWFGYEKDSMKEMHTYALVKFLSQHSEDEGLQ